MGLHGKGLSTRSIREMALAAFGSAAEWLSYHPLARGNFELLT
jgi:hypothetical protein